jgi:general secretion pathway protein N
LKRRLAITLAVLIAFLAVILAQFPARWAAAALPGGITCRDLAGTLWQGNCSGLDAYGTAVGDLDWTLHPAGALLGRLDLDLALDAGGQSIHGRVQLTPGARLSASGVKGIVPLDRQWFPQLSTLPGANADLDIASLHFDGRRLTSLVGRIDVHGVRSGGSLLGDYRLLFTGGADEPVARVSDLGGPLSVEGTLRLTREPGYVLEGRVAARPGAPPEIVKELPYLGSPDAQGRRPFSVAGTF